jgi:hypothetical protein
MIVHMKFQRIVYYKCRLQKTSELKSELKKRGVRGYSTKTKAHLLELLQDSLKRGDPIGTSDNNNNKKSDMACFAPTAYWKPLVALPTPVSEPDNVAFF